VSGQERPEVVVLCAYVTKSEAFPQGKRWEAYCSTCKWCRRVGWKGQYRLAQRLAVGHECQQEAVESCAGG
jgi:predicted Rdx family selenoprotein